MIRTLPALLLLIALTACDSDGDPKAEETPTATATTSATPTPTPAPTPTPTPAPVLTQAPKPTKTIKPAPILSACAKIWKAGAVLPASYAGCPTVSGEEAAAPSPCNTGGTWATYATSKGSFVAVLGGPIYKRDPNVDGNYESTYEGCTGEG